MNTNAKIDAKDTTESTTAPEAPADTNAPAPAPEATTAPLTPITAAIKEGEKFPSLQGVPEGWHTTRTLAVSPDGSEYAFIANNRRVYQGFMGDVDLTATAWGYVFGAKQKADSDGGSDKTKTAETATRITGTVAIEDWIKRSERTISVDPLSAQVRAILLTRLGPLGKVIKAKGIKLTGFTGGVEGMLSRYATVIKEATGRKATKEQWEGFCAKVREEAAAALAEVNDADPFA